MALQLPENSSANDPYGPGFTPHCVTWSSKNERLRILAIANEPELAIVPKTIWIPDPSLH